MKNNIKYTKTHKNIKLHEIRFLYYKFNTTSSWNINVTFYKLLIFPRNFVNN